MGKRDLTVSLNIDGTRENAAGMARALQRASDAAGRFAANLKQSAAAGMYLLGPLRAGLRSMQVWFLDALAGSEAVRTGLARLREGFLALAAPVLNVAIPAFALLADMLGRAAVLAGSVLEAVFGRARLTTGAKTAKTLDNEAKALGGVSAAAEEAAGSLAAFDEINTIDTEPDVSRRGSSGGAGDGDGLAPAAGDLAWTSDLSARLADVAKWVALIGAGFALWQLGERLPGVLGAVVQKLGLVAALAGSVGLFWDGLKNAWREGVGWASMLEMIAGTALGAFAALKLLGGAAGTLAAGALLIAGGAAMVVTAFHDALAGGMDWQNTLLAIAGLLSGGLGIGLLTGSWIPLAIAGIASLLLAFTQAAGRGEALIQGLREVLGGFRTFFAGVFSGDLDRALAGIESIFRGFGDFFGTLWASLQDVLDRFLDWLDEITGGKITPLIDAIRRIFSAGFSEVGGVIRDAWNGLKGVLQGVITFVSGVFAGSWSQAWAGIRGAFASLWSGVSGIVRGGINTALGAVESFLNSIVRAVNGLLSGVDWVAGVFGKRVSYRVNYVSVPRLAQGAVIPPNREFLAVLGDQTRGSNIEAPEALLRQIVREEAGAGDSVQLLRDILAALRAGQVLTVDRQVLGRTAVRAINDLTGQAGRSVLKV